VDWVQATWRNLPEEFLEKRNGDLLAVPDSPSFAPETLMMYLGTNGTYTCAHFDLVGSLGHNLLLDSDEGPTSIWFIVRGTDHEKARSFWLENGGCLEKDNCFLSWDVLAYAPFPVYVVMQGKGDFVLVPSDSAHQVFNKGRNVKISWNRLPPSCIETAYFRVLPRYRDVGREETYRVVGLAYYGLLEWVRRLRHVLDEYDADKDVKKRDRVIDEAKSLGSLLLVVCDFAFNQRLNKADPLWTRIPAKKVVEEVAKNVVEEVAGVAVASAAEGAATGSVAEPVVPAADPRLPAASVLDVASVPEESLSGSQPDCDDEADESDEFSPPHPEVRVKRWKKPRYVTESKDMRNCLESDLSVVVPEISPLPPELPASVMTCDVCNSDLFCRFIKCDECEPKKLPCDFCLKCVSEQRGCQSHRQKLRICELMPLEDVEGALAAGYALYNVAWDRVKGQLARLAPLEHEFGVARRSDCTCAALVISGALKNRIISCHGCKKRNAGRYSIPCSQCDALFCDACFWNRHGERMSDKLRHEKWVCYRCTFSCNCVTCRRNLQFVSFLPFGLRSINQVGANLLPLHDRAAPLVQVDGLGNSSFVYLVPLRVFPAPPEWVGVTVTTLLLARDKDGFLWPARRATSEDEPRAQDWGRPNQIMVRFHNVSRCVAWLPLSDVVVKPSKSILREAQQALSEELGEKFEAALQGLKVKNRQEDSFRSFFFFLIFFVKRTNLGRFVGRRRSENLLLALLLLLLLLLLLHPLPLVRLGRRL
jgi:hypothetical protein